MSNGEAHHLTRLSIYDTIGKHVYDCLCHGRTYVNLILLLLD